jgi:hypothetical protein
MFDTYIRKKFDLLELKSDFGNTYAMLLARNKDYKHVEKLLIRLGTNNPR